MVFFKSSLVSIVCLIASAIGNAAEPAKLPAKDKFHLYLLIGQSNMAGRGVIEEDDRNTHPRVLKYTQENSWALAVDPLHFDKPAIVGVGLGSSFGRAMADAEQDVTIGLVPCAVGGTPLSRWEANGDLHKQAIARVKVAMQAGTLKGILWHQGEADAADKQLSDSYGMRLAQMIGDLRKELGTLDAPFVAGKLGEFLPETRNDQPSYWRRVNEELAGLPNRVAHVAVVDSAGLKHKGDDVHFDSPSLRELGKRYAQAMRGLQAKPAVSRAALGTKVRVAAISLVPVKFDLQGNVERLENAFRSASRSGAVIAVAPEGVLEGYVVNEIIAGKAKAEGMKDVALKIDDPILQRFQHLAIELKMCLVFGFAEIIGDEIFNCAVFIDESGNICGKHHKMQLAEGSHPDWWFNRLGSHSRAFDTPYGRCGIMICNERWNPTLGRILALDGAQFLLIPSYGSRSKSQDEAVLLLGKENRVPVVEANVGVTMLVDGGQISALERNEEGITIGEIVIPQSSSINTSERDRVEGEFLVWRDQEMILRYEKSRQRAVDKKESKK